jgi:hypothetical protein
VVWLCLAFFCVAALSPSAPAQDALPIVSDFNPGQIRSQCEELLTNLSAARGPWSGQALSVCKELCRDKQAGAAEKIQGLLDPYCLVAVTINPESRVKVMRGPVSAQLQLGQSGLFLAKVINEGGVTHPLSVAGAGIATRGTARDEDWLEASIVPLARKSLSGARLEYVLLRLVPHTHGKREATFRFDVGQGTQDLGFRAEIPILFNVRRQ